MTKGLVLLTLAGLAGGAYYIAKRKPSDGYRSNELDPPESAQNVLDPEMLALYQAIIYGHGTPQDCLRVLEYIDHLAPENDAEEVWLATVRSDVTQACAAGPVAVASDPPVLPNVFPTQMVTDFNGCWARLDCDVNAVVSAFSSFMQSRSDFISDAAVRQVNAALLALQDRYTSVSGVPHVGDCGCASCEANRVGQDEEPCCEACALAGVGSCSCQQALESEYDRSSSGMTAGGA